MALIEWKDRYSVGVEAVDGEDGLHTGDARERGEHVRQRTRRDIEDEVGQRLGIRRRGDGHAANPTASAPAGSRRS